MIGEFGRQFGAEMMREPVEKIVWEIVENHQERQLLRWQEYSNTKDARLRAGILNDIADDEERYWKLLQSMGVVFKAPEKLDVREVQTWADLAAMIDEHRDERRSAEDS